MNFGMCSFDMHKKNRLLRVRQEIGSNSSVVNCKNYLVNVVHMARTCGLWHSLASAKSLQNIQAVRL